MSHFRAISRNTCWIGKALHLRSTRYRSQQGVTSNLLKYTESNECNVSNGFTAYGRASLA